MVQDHLREFDVYYRSMTFWRQKLGAHAVAPQVEDLLKS